MGLGNWREGLDETSLDESSLAESSRVESSQYDEARRDEARSGRDEARRVLDGYRREGTGRGVPSPGYTRPMPVPTRSTYVGAARRALTWSPRQGDLVLGLLASDSVIIGPLRHRYGCQSGSRMAVWPSSNPTRGTLLRSGSRSWTETRSLMRRSPVSSPDQLINKVWQG